MTRLIAEVGCSHGWDMLRADELIDACAKAGADYVKFQCHRGNPLKPDEGDFTDEEWGDILKACQHHGVGFTCSPFSMDAAHMLHPLVWMWKIASGQITNLPLVEFCASTGKLVLLSTGLGTSEEITRAIHVMQNANRFASNYVLMDCISIYPTPAKYWNNNCSDHFGLSDHSGTIYPSLLAAAARVPFIEVHVKDNDSVGNDLDASVTMDELRMIANGVRLWSQANEEMVPDDHLESMRERYLYRA